MADQAALEAAHKKSIFHRAEIEKSVICGCFHCEAVFPPAEIEHWTDKSKPKEQWTALCPECGIDSVLGDATGFAPYPAFLVMMKQRWFAGE